MKTTMSDVQSKSSSTLDVQDVKYNVDIPSDLLTPARHSFALQERIPGALLHVWPAMGHAPFWEAPSELNPILERFVRDVETGRASRLP